MKCSECGTEHADTLKFCGECGARLVPVPPEGAAATGNPGRVFDKTRAFEQTRPAEPDRTVDGERRLVTILFADVSGFTTLSEKLDPEALRDLITACFDRLVPCIKRYGGTVDKFVGDEIMALFGAPVAHENDPERALRAALEMRRTLASFNEERQAPLAIHFGVNTGLVYAGDVGGGGRRDYSVMGDAVNTASRLKGLAKPGEIVVGADTYRQVGHLFEWQTAGTVRVKGKAEPVTAYRLIDVRSVASGALARETRGLSSSLVGRENELGAFTQAIDRAGRGLGGVLFVTGEAGLGKSRLVAEARARAGKLGVGWLEGRTLSFGRTISYWPLLEIIQQDAGIESDDPEAERWAKLAGRVGGLFGEESAEVLPYLATLLNLPVPEDLAHKVRDLDGEAMGRQVYRASLLFFRRLAQKRPLVLVFEDVHWLDGSSASLLEHLLPLTREAPLLFCFVSRPETDSALTRLQELAREAYADCLTEVALHPLSSEESTALVRNLVQLDNLPPRLRDTILDRAEGNPFFVEEVVRSLIDLGGLVRDESTGRWRVTEQATRVTIPDTLQGVIMARVDRLDEDLKQVLRLASVIGRSFFYRVLDSIAEADERLNDDLAALESAELVRERTRDPELEYIFKHALVQEATYESILLQRRKELHRRVAAAIEDLFGGRLEEFYGLLAYHYSKAEDWEKAQQYLFKAGDQAGNIAADAEALAHYDRAFEAYSRVFGDTWDPLERASLERRMGEALLRRGEHEQAAPHLYRVLEILGSPYPATSGAQRRALLKQTFRQVGHRLRLRLPQRTVSEEATRIAEERCLVYVALGSIDTFADQWRWLLDLLLMLNLAESAGVQWAAANGFSEIGVIGDVTARHRIARFYHGLGVRMAERSGRPFTKAHAEHWYGVHEYSIGNHDGAAHCLQRSAQTFRELGNTRLWALSEVIGVHVPVDRGQFAEPLALVREVSRLSRETGDRMSEAWGRCIEGEILYLSGELDAGQDALRASAEAMVDMSDFRTASYGAGRLAESYLKQGRIDEAEALLKQHHGNMEDRGISGFTGRYVMTGLALAALMRAEQAEDAERRAALDEAERACDAVLRHGECDALALVLGYRLRGTHEWLRGPRGRAEHWWQKSLDLADKLGARYEGALTHLEIGRRLGNRDELERAEAEFAEMGAGFDLAEARRLLGQELDPSAPREETGTTAESTPPKLAPDAG